MPTAQLNDAKHAGLATLNSNATDVQDGEFAYLDSVITADPPTQDDNQARWHEYWDQLGTVAAGSFNDRAWEWLTEAGHTDATLNEKWLSYWADNA